MSYDRSAIMKRANVLRRERGISQGDAMRLAWSEARQARASSNPPAPATRKRRSKKIAPARAGSNLPALLEPAPLLANFPAAQPGGLRATLERYGLTGSRLLALPERAARTVAAIVGGSNSPAQVGAWIAEAQAAEIRLLPRGE